MDDAKIIDLFGTQTNRRKGAPDDSAVGFDQEINGYGIDGHSVFTDGFGYQIVLKITAPEDVDLTTPLEHTFAVGPGDGVRGHAQDDGDGHYH